MVSKPQTPLHLRQAQGLPALEWACGDVGRGWNALKVSDHNQQEREKASTHMLGHERVCLAPHSQVPRGRDCTIRPTWSESLPEGVTGSLGAGPRWGDHSELVTLILFKQSLLTSTLLTPGAG